MKRFLIILLISVISINNFAQKIFLKGDVNTDNYPQIYFKINVYNPTIKTKTDFKIKELNNNIDFTINYVKPKIDDNSKVILILFEDMTHSTHYGQRKKCRYILEKSIPDFVNPGDSVNIAVFDRNRDGSTPLRLVSDKYSDDTDFLINKINNFKTIKDYQSNNKSSDLYNAIYDGIAELKNKFPDRNKILLVLSAGRNLDQSNYNSIETLIQKAKNEKVAVYSMQYMIWEHENIDALALETFGKKFHIQGSYKIKGKHDENSAADSLSAFMNNAVERLYGQDYEINYETSFEKDGKLHNLVVSVDNISENISFKAPACNLICKFKKEPFLYGGISLIILILIIFIILKIVKQLTLKKLKQAELELEIKKQNNEIGRIEKENKQKLNEQQELFLKEKEDKIKAEKEQKIAKQKKEEEKNLILQMKQLRGFPKLLITTENEKTEFIIDKPLVTVGRNPDNSLILKDDYISGKHFKIFFIDDSFILEDLGSSNGTKLNGNIVKQVKLKHNDIIEAGNFKIMFIH